MAFMETPERRGIRKALENTNGVWLMELIRKRYRHLLAMKRKLEWAEASPGGDTASSSDSPLCGVPSGTSSSYAAPPPATPIPVSSK